MAYPKVRVSDSHSHGGSVVGGSPNVITNGLADARIGDPVGCVIHGMVAVGTGNPKVQANGIPIARMSVDKTTCGSAFTSGSPNVDHDVG